jgi:hypothetical protein
MPLGAPNLPWQYRDHERYSYPSMVSLDAWAGGRPNSTALPSISV